MALTVGTTCYDDSRGHTLTDLINRDDVKVAIRQYFEKDALANALRKLEGWINVPWYAQWRKGQNKSFATAREMVLWLQYKSEKVFQPAATREKELAELINDCPGIRRAVAQFISTHLVREFNYLAKAQRDAIATEKGRYAHFYSKIFFKRNLGEGLSYFKNQRNPSLSEMAAFLADFGLEARDFFTKKSIIYTKGHDELRTNQAQVDAAVAEAMRRLDSDPLYQRVRARTEAPLIDAAVRLPELKLKVTASYNKTREIIQNASSLAEIRSDRGASKLFNEFKARPEAQGFSDNEDAAFSSPQWRAHKRGLIRNLVAAATDPTATANAMFAEESGAEMKQRTEMAAVLAGVRVEKEKKAVDSVKRGNHNVVVDHQWTKFMMERNQVIGAGPSSTTAVTLGLVNYCIMNTLCGDETRFAVAASLFAFWQRKKHILRLRAAVHTWNEVMTALDNYLPPISNYKVPLDWSASDEMQCKVYEYPDSFAEDGLPIFPSNVTT